MGSGRSSDPRSLSDLGVRREGKRDRDQNLCKFEANSGLFNEDLRKFWPISAFPQQNHPKSDRLLGRGGVSAVAKAIGISRTTIYAGLSELDSGGSLSEAPSSSERTAARTSISQRRVRAKGGGRKKLTDKDPTLLSDLRLC